MRSEEQVIEILNSIAVVNTVRELATEEAVQVYLAGDAIRDLFLGLTPTEFDLVVSSNPTKFAHKIAAIKPGHIRNDESDNLACYTGELGTLNIVPLKGRSIQQCVDLYYRFTVNCVVFDLEHSKVIYFHNAEADIENEVVRIISSAYPTSYPPYLPLRAVQLALLTPTFALDHQTFLSVRSNSALVARAKPSSVFRELSTILRSKEYIRGVKLLDDVGLLREIFKNLLPFAASEEQGSIYANELSALNSTINICAAMDEMIGPFQASLLELISDYALLLRTAALLIPKMKQSMLNMAHADRKQFLITRGEQIEKALCNAMLPSRAFRIRIIVIGYLLGIASLHDRNVTIEEVSEQSVKTFGSWKGLLTTILICADWLASEGRRNERPKMLNLARAILDINIAPLICQKSIQ